MATGTLRFAPLIRVSGETQARYGESLRTQREQIEKAVQKLGGVIPKELAERYTGQEHATPGYERERFGQLLKDAGDGLFDAVMVADPSRWSRDNGKGREGIRVLKRHGIRFFSLDTEYDLTDALAGLTLGMFDVINQFVAQTQTKKSRDNRLARLRRGCPACGARPFGRTFDKTTEQWGIDRKAQEFIETVAQRYIAGDALRAMAREYRQSMTTLWRNLVQQSGPEFFVQYNKPRLDGNQGRIRRSDREIENLVNKNRHRATRIHERVQEIDLPDLHLFIIDVPPLLDAETLDKVHRQAEKRRKNRGKRKYKYLLSGFLRCADCGMMMGGQCQDRTPKAYRYYRHNPTERIDGHDCSQPGLYMDADIIEEAVLLHVFNVLGNTAAIEASIARANPNKEEQEKARQEIEEKRADLKRTAARKARVMAAYENGAYDLDEMRAQKEAIEHTEEALKTRIAQLGDTLAAAAPPAVVKRAANRLAKRAKAGGYRELFDQMAETTLRDAAIGSATGADVFDRMTFEEKRSLLELFFEGKGPDGRDLGVYITRDPNWKLRARKGRKWQFEIRGRFSVEPSDRGEVPLSDKNARILRDELDSGNAARERNLETIYTSFNPKCGGPRG